MSTNPSTKLYWNDWDNDRALALCSLAAQGLWMRMLSLAARSEGYIRVNGKPCSTEDIAILVGHPLDEVSPLIAELAARGVFSRTRDGTIYNRRMVRDEKNRKISKREGRKGGNPALLANSGNQTKKSRPLNPPVKGGVNGGGFEGGSAPIPLTPIPFKESPLSPPKGKRRSRGSFSDPEFDEWYEGYPHKVAKGAAEKAWQKARKLASLAELKMGLERYIATKPPDYDWCGPGVWLNQKRWLDQPAGNKKTEVRHDGPSGPPPPLPLMH